MAKKPEEENKLENKNSAPEAKLDYTTIIQNAMNNRASADTVRNLWEQRQAHVDQNPGLEKYRYDNYDTVQRYISDNAPKEPQQNSATFTYGAAPTYNDDYKARTDELLDRVLNRPAFSYDAQSDPLYQQLKTQYTREGERAMKDTLGEVSARTGGLASSYATAAAQEANNYYMQQLSDKIPELQQLAYSMYLDDINAQRDDLALLRDMSDTVYGRYRDALGDWSSDRAFAYNAHRDALADDRADAEWEYNLGRDALADQRYDAEWEYNLGRDALADQRYDKEWAYQVAQDAKAARAGNSSSGEDPLVAAVADIANVSYETALALKNNGSTKWPDMLARAGFGGEESGVSDGAGDNGDTGSNTGTGEEPEIDMGSVMALGLALGRGRLSADDLAALVQSGEAKMYVEDGKTKFRLANNGYDGYFQR